ncbi:hypothetical protein CG709_19995, partial [Lachnotalea glycerini]
GFVGLAGLFFFFSGGVVLAGPVDPNGFFKDGKPKDIFALNCIYFGRKSAGFFNGNDMELINIHFKKKQVMKRDFWKWYNPVNGFKMLVRTTLLIKWPWFPGFYYNHLPSNFLKSTFEEVWGIEGETLDATCMDKFRTKSNVNQWLFKFWQLASGNFIPSSPKVGRSFNIKDKTFPATIEAIETGQYKLICVNDTIYTSDFEKQKVEVQGAFKKILSEKSSFEK